MKKRIFFIWSLLLVTIGSFGSSKVYQQVVAEQFRNEIAGIALNDSFPSADRFGNLYPGTVAQNIINVLNTDPSGVQLTKSERQYVIAIVSGLRPVWSKMKAVYGFVGGNAWKHKWNWKDMRDLDEAYRLTSIGIIMYSNSGSSIGGSNGVFNTYLNPSVALQINSCHLSMYINTSLAQGGFDMGAHTSTIPNQRLSLAINRNNDIGYVNDITNIAGTTINVNGNPGCYIINRYDSNNKQYVLRGDFNNFSAISNSLPPISIYIGGINGVAAGNLIKTCAFASIGDGLTPQQAIQMSHTVTFAQGILNRQ